MKSFAAKFFTLLFLTLVITAVMPTSAQARPTIKFRVEHVYLHEAGEAEIVGYFENVGDQAAYVKWTDIGRVLDGLAYLVHLNFQWGVTKNGQSTPTKLIFSKLFPVNKGFFKI